MADTGGADGNATQEKKGKAMRWKVGDEVQLKSTGPTMTVLEDSDEGVGCGWFDKSSKLHEYTFPDATLIKASSRLTINVNLCDDSPKANA